MTRLIRRGADEPTGVARLTFSYLASVLAVVGAVLVAVIASPIISSSGLCAVDPTELCQPILVGGVGIVSYFALTLLAAWLFALGVVWSGWIVLVDLVALELFVQTSFFRWLALGLIAPAVAAVATATWSDGVASGVRVARRVTAGVLTLQLAAWLVIFLVG
jgi:hypothetical protein